MTDTICSIVKWLPVSQPMYVWFIDKYNPFRGQYFLINRSEQNDLKFVDRLNTDSTKDKIFKLTDRQDPEGFINSILKNVVT